MKLTIFGQPITKKNSQNAFAICPKNCPGQQANLIIKRMGNKPQRPIINLLQSDAYRTYEKKVKKQLSLTAYKPISGPVSVKALYYLATARTPDLSNLIAATHDLLEGCGVIINDSQIKSVDGSRIMGKDPDPRVEVEILPFIEQEGCGV